MKPSPAEQLRKFWNQRYSATDYIYGKAPNDFLRSVAQSLPSKGKVLCLADGEGRNGVWLAEQGFAVTSLDISAEGVRKTGALAAERGVSLVTEVADVSVHDLGSNTWEAIVSIFLHLPPRLRAQLHQRCMTALRPGGVMVFESYGTRQLGRGTGGPPEAELLPTLAEVEQEFSGLQVIHRYEGLRDVYEGSHHHGPGEVVQLLLKKH